MTVGTALTLYAREHAVHAANPQRIGHGIQTLAPFWQDVVVAGVTRETCRAYVKRRAVGAGTVGYELRILRAALKFAVKEGALLSAPSVEIPDPPDSRQRALTRDEVARMLWACRKPKRRHMARFILVSLYTGTRKEAVLALRLHGPSTVGGWMDLEKGILHRRGQDQRETGKRRPKARIPRQLLAHARRWRAAGAQWAVEWRGERVVNPYEAWDAMLKDAALSWRPTPHSLKHTSLTWFFEAGGAVEDAVAFFGTSRATIDKVYRDKSPRWQANAVAVVERGGRRR